MTRGVIFDIQRYSIHDGPGIRTTVFLKGCPLVCFWCQNPESQSGKQEIFLNKGKCSLCGRCVVTCTTGAAKLGEESSIIDRSICIACGKCVAVCPNEARRLVGQYVTVDEVMDIVLKDKKFYENSGGGITISGGEPASQPSFTLALLKRSKEEGLHTVLDTCGYAKWSTLKKLLEYTDLVLYDIKHVDPEKHHEATGKDNSLILSNAKKIAKFKLMRVRVPIIPGFNDSFEEVDKIANFVKTELGSIPIDLLPYNKLCESKYELLGREFISKEARDEDYMRSLEAIVQAEVGSPC